MKRVRGTKGGNLPAGSHDAESGRGLCDRRLRVSLLAVPLLVSLAGTAVAETRTLNLENEHTQERISITFKRDGHYIPSALAELNHFLRDWRRNEETRMDPRLFDVVWEVYQKTGATEPVQVICGYRSLATNDMLRTRSRMVAKHSQHTLGKAMDIRIPGVDPERVREIALKMEYGGVGYYSPGAGNFSHLDVGSVRAWPRVPRNLLVRLFPDGKTVHIPADGHPLAGYDEAKAELASRGIGTSEDGGEEDGGSTAVASNSGGGFFASLFGSAKKAPADAPVAVATAVPAVEKAPRQPVMEPLKADTRMDSTSVAAAAPALPAARARPAEPERVAMAFDAPAAAPPARSQPVQRATAQETSEPQQPDLVWQKGAEPVLKGSAGPGAADETPAAPQRRTAAPQQLAFSAPLPSRLPQERPDLGEDGDAGTVADSDVPSVLPRPKPVVAPDVAESAAPAAGELAMLPPQRPADIDPDGPVPPGFVPVTASAALPPQPVARPAMVLGYAPLPREPNIEDLIPRLPPHKSAMRQTPRQVMPEPSPVVALGTGKSDPEAALQRASLPSQVPLLDPTTTTRRAEFAVLRATDPAHLPGILKAPDAIIAGGFVPFTHHPAVTSTFTGEAVRVSAVIWLAGPPVQSASR